MVDELVAHTGPDGQTCLGQRLYSPAVIAAYTVAINLPMGFILYGLNLRSRGQRGRSTLMSLVGGIGLVVLLSAAFLGASRHWQVFQVVGAVGALNVYYLEKGPFDLALRRGATRASWW